MDVIGRRSQDSHDILHEHEAVQTERAPGASCATHQHPRHTAIFIERLKKVEERLLACTEQAAVPQNTRAALTRNAPSVKPDATGVSGAPTAGGVAGAAAAAIDTKEKTQQHNQLVAIACDLLFTLLYEPNDKYAEQNRRLTG